MLKKHVHRAGGLHMPNLQISCYARLTTVYPTYRKGPKTMLDNDSKIPHGTKNGYTHHGCRCAECRAANTQAVEKWRARRQGDFIADEDHGTRKGYRDYGCRCDSCRAANTEYARLRRAARKKRATVETPQDAAYLHPGTLIRDADGRVAVREPGRGWCYTGQSESVTSDRVPLPARVLKG